MLIKYNNCLSYNEYPEVHKSTLNWIMQKNIKGFGMGLNEKKMFRWAKKKKKKSNINGMLQYTIRAYPAGIQYNACVHAGVRI